MKGKEKGMKNWIPQFYVFFKLISKLQSAHPKPLHLIMHTYVCVCVDAQELD